LGRIGRRTRLIRSQAREILIWDYKVLPIHY
jgi:hypothetical protein